MLELINQLDGFDPRGNIKVLMATNRCTPALTHHVQPTHPHSCSLHCSVASAMPTQAPPPPPPRRPDTLDPALMRPGRMDRRVEFGLPDLEVGGRRGGEGRRGEEKGREGKGGEERK